jgi:hypothetical protein
MWTPKELLNSTCLSSESIQSHFTKFFATVTLAALSDTQALNAPNGTTWRSRGAGSPGTGSTPKSSPCAAMTFGRSHKPPHCIAVSPLMKGEASDQSAEADLTMPGESNSVLYWATQEYRAGSLKVAAVLVALISDSPAAQISSSPKTPTPPSWPAKKPPISGVATLLATCVSSSSVAGGCRFLAARADLR